MEESILLYIAAFAAVIMAVVFGFRSWMLAKRERRSRQLRRRGSRQSRGFSRRSSRHSRHSSSSRSSLRGERGSDNSRDRTSRGDFRGDSSSQAGPEDSSSPRL